LKNLKFKISPWFLVFGGVLVYFNLGKMFLFYLIAILLHELGHAVVAKRLGYKLSTITLMPYGTELSGEQTIFSLKDEILISLAGPFVNLVLIILNLALWWLYPIYYSFTELFVVANLASLLFNLLPVFPLDGGRVLLSVMSSKMTRKTAYYIIKILGIVIASIFFLLFLVSIFYTINFTFFVVSFFLMAGSLDNNKNITYNTVITMCKTKNLVKKPKIIKNIAISEGASLITAVKMLDPNAFNRFYVLDEEYKTSSIINEVMLKKLVLKHSVSQKFSEIL
jgi:stage IV sporulation protein FB